MKFKCETLHIAILQFIEWLIFHLNKQRVRKHNCFAMSKIIAELFRILYFKYHQCSKHRILRSKKIVIAIFKINNNLFKTQIWSRLFFKLNKLLIICFAIRTKLLKTSQLRLSNQYLSLLNSFLRLVIV